MVNFLSRKPKSPDAVVARQLGNCLAQFLEHYVRSGEITTKSLPEVDMFDIASLNKEKQDLGEYLAQLDKAENEVEIARGWINSAMGLWPDGRVIFNEFLRSTDYWRRVIANTRALARIFRGPNLLGSCNQEQIRSIFLQNRVDSAEADKHMKKAATLLDSYPEIKLE